MMKCVKSKFCANFKLLGDYYVKNIVRVSEGSDIRCSIGIFSHFIVTYDSASFTA